MRKNGESHFNRLRMEIHFHSVKSSRHDEGASSHHTPSLDSICICRIFSLNSTWLSVICGDVEILTPKYICMSKQQLQSGVRIVAGRT